MNVDMFVKKFLRRLDELPEYQDIGRYDRTVMEAPIPVMRASFSSAYLFTQNAGYTLPDFDFFKRIYCSAVRRHYDFQKFSYLFASNGEPCDELLYRLSVTYESCMAEAYLNVCLAEAIEDRLKAGVVVYDPRCDWKMKWDSLVLFQGQVFVINSYWQGSDRRATETRRERAERIQKQNTSASSHWGNIEIGAFTRVDVRRDESNSYMRNGFRLFSDRELDTALGTIWDRSGVPMQARPTMSMMHANTP